MVQYRKRRRVETCSTYLHGTGHKLREDLEVALEERNTDLPGTSCSAGASTTSASTTSASIVRSKCLSCTPVLEQLKVNFDSLVQTGRELRHCKRVLPEPRKPDKLHYRNLVAQNQWIRNNLFDDLGNYHYCQKCIHKVLKIGTQHLAHQRAIKRQEALIPLVDMTKSQIV